MVFPVIGGDGKPTGYDISNSLRFNDGDSAYLSRTPSTATNDDKLTFSFWAKRSTPSANHKILTRYSSADNRFYIGWANNDKLYIYQKVGGTESFNLQTNRLFRDPSAWYHIVVAFDTTQGTDTNRIKLYVNGTQETSFSTSNYPTQNLDLYYQTATSVVAKIGQYDSSQYYDGYFSDMYLIDGQQLAPTEFGETNDNGVWIPIKYLGTYGDEGFKLEFKQTGTSQNSSGMGADTSGNDHHFAVSNLAATDVTTDTPTNNFATFNALYASNTQTNGYRTTLSEGNLKAVSQADGKTSGISSIGVANGKWYAEFKQTAVSNANGYGLVGVHSDLTPMLHNNPNGNGVLGYSPHGYAYWGYNASTSDGYKMNDDNNSTYGSPYDAGDIIGLAIDLDNGAMYVSLNGTFQESSDPTSGASKTNAIFALPDASTKPDGFYFMSVGDSSSTHTVTWEANFGNPTFAISSGNSDANGYGNFEYAVPSGYYALCTKNIAEYG